MSKLLNKPLRTFILFTILVLAGSIPVYFNLLEHIWLDELDSHNEQLKEEMRIHFNEADTNKLKLKIALWNEIQSSSQINPTTKITKDSIYIVEREILDDGIKELERFRGLYSTIDLNGKPYSVVIETNVEEVHETVFSIAMITCAFIALLIVGFIFLNRRISKKIWEPFSDTLNKLKGFDLNKSEKIDLKETDIQEFSELNAVLLKLIDNNTQVFRQQKEFTQNASHELQTPLALLKTKIDLLIQDASLNAEQRKIIESLDNTVSRVSRINKNLLLLAGIENKHYDKEEVDLSELTKNLAEVFNEHAESRGSEISMKIQSGIRINANESLVEFLLSNLFSNAVRHGEPNSIIMVDLNDRVLLVSNSGKFPLKENNLFKRFSSATENNPGTGLGLAIVKEICDKYGWQVTYMFKENKHIFSVAF